MLRIDNGNFGSINGIGGGSSCGFVVGMNDDVENDK